jgi:asparagine synthase (glutamine-hydrolysing)
MCGIAGIVRFDQPASASRAAVELMLQRMRHRGPDNSAVIVNTCAVLGNTRLSLIDRTGGMQPMTSPDGRWHLTYNGEVYNAPELRNELRAQWTFRTRCDTEVVLAALVVWGQASLHRFNGMFALFLWDERTHTGFAARDRLGVKPFIFSHERGVFAFASEAKALLALKENTARADMQGVLEYLVAPYFSGIERSMFATLQPLLPGEWLRVTCAGIEREAWWDWRLPEEWRQDETMLAPALADHLERGVERAMRADYPVGSFLSGGLDSTLLSSLAARRGAGELKTFTIHFQDQAEFDYRRSTIVRSDDTPFAEAAAREIGLDHTRVPVRRDNLANELRRLAEINDALPAWEQELAQYHLARAVHQAGLRCVLVGDAADETHYGYPFLLDVDATCSPGNILRRFGQPPLNRAWADAHTDRTFGERYRALAEAAGYRWDTPLSRLLATTYLIVKRWLPRLLHNGDIHLMAFSVEGRVPFADTDIVEFARMVHPSVALRDGREKNLLRQSARGLMPEASRIRPKSALPSDQRTTAVFQHEAIHALDASGDFLRAWLDLAPIRELCRPQRELTESERALLFRVIVLHHWRQHYNVGVP